MTPDRSRWLAARPWIVAAPVASTMGSSRSQTGQRAGRTMRPSGSSQVYILLTKGSGEPDWGPGVDYYDSYRYYFRPRLPHYRNLADSLLTFIEANAAPISWERATLISENLRVVEAHHERLNARLTEFLEVSISTRRNGLGPWEPLFDVIERKDCAVATTGWALGGITPLNQKAQQERNFDLGGLKPFAMASNYWEQTDGNAKYTFTVDGLTLESDNTGGTQGFVADYTARFGAAPVYSAMTT